MGYNMEQTDAKFTILAANRRPCLAAIKSLIGKGTCRDSSGAHFAWVEDEDIEAARTVDAAFDAWGWGLISRPPSDEDPTAGDVTGIHFEAEKMGDEETLFAAVAPYVEPGSYIEMLGEDGDRWRWAFDGRTCKEIHAETRWPHA